MRIYVTEVYLNLSLFFNLPSVLKLDVYYNLRILLTFKTSIFVLKYYKKWLKFDLISISSEETI